MKRKQLFKVLIFIGIISVMLLTGCYKKKATLVSWDFKESNPTEVLSGNFDYSDFYIVEKYSDNTEKEIQITEDMVPAEDFFKTTREGTQTIRVIHNKETKTFNIAVKCYEFDTSSIYVINKTGDDAIIYDGNPHSLEIAGEIPEGTTITTPRGNSFTNAETYDIEFVLASDKYMTKTIVGHLEIKKATFDTSKLKYSSVVTTTYDGKDKTVKDLGFDETEITKVGGKVSYSIDNEPFSGVKLANEEGYKIKVSFEMNGNYNAVQPITITLIVNKGQFDTTIYKLNNDTVTYDGDKHGLQITNEDSLISQGLTVKYEYSLKDKNQYTTTVPKNAGVYDVKATLICDNQSNYKEIQPIYAKLTINKATIDITNYLHLDYQEFTYDGKEHMLTVAGEYPTGITPNGFNYSTGLIDAGTYEIEARFKYRDEENYNPIEPLRQTMVINKAELTGIVYEQKEQLVYNGTDQKVECTITDCPQGVKISYDDTVCIDAGTYTVNAYFTYEDGSVAAKNYKAHDPVSCRFTIDKKSISSNFNDLTVSYEKDKYYMIKIADEKLQTGITVTYKRWNPASENEDKTEAIPGTGDTYGFNKPGQYTIYAYYNVDYATMGLTEEQFNQNYIFVPYSEAILNIKRIDLDLSNYLADVQILYVNNSTDYSVKFKTDVDTQTFIANTFSTTPIFTYYNIDKNQLVSCNNIGIYYGKIEFSLKKTALEYYNEITSYEFMFAVRNSNPIDYIPEYNISEVTYDGSVKKVSIINLPIGINALITNNENTDAGIYNMDVKFTFDNPIIDWYYKFPAGYDHTTNGYDGSYNLTINKKEYTIEYNVGPFVYDKDRTDKFEITAKNCPDYVTLEFEYQNDDIEESRLKPGTYYVRVTKTVTDELSSKNYKFTNEVVEFVVAKANMNFEYNGLNISYDEEYHTVSVNGINIDNTDFEAVITYKDLNDVTYPNGVKDEGKYTALITINLLNDAVNYYNSINYVISRTVNVSCVQISLNNFFDKINKTGLKYNQLITVEEILKGFIDINAFDITWTLQNGKHPAIVQTIKDDGTNSNLNYRITFTTNDNYSDEYARLNVTLKLRSGYKITNSDYEKLGGLYDSNNKEINFNFKFYLRSVTIVDLSNLNTSLGTDYATIQGASVNDILKKFIDSNQVTYEYIADYYYKNTKYTDLYSNLNSYYHGEGDLINTFYLSQNTWGDRYVLVNYTIKAKEGYGFKIGDEYAIQYSSTVKLHVDIKNTIDINPLQNAFNETIIVNEYTSFAEYLNELITNEKNTYNTNYVTYTWTLTQGDNEIASSSNVKGILQQQSGTPTYKLNVIVTCLAGYKFNNGETSYTKEAKVAVTSQEGISTKEIDDYLDTINYSSLYAFENFKTFVQALDIPEGLTLKYRVKYGNGEYSDYYNIDDDYIFTNNVTDDNYYSISYKFIPDTNYVIYNPTTNINIGTHEKEVVNKVNKVTINSDIQSLDFAFKINNSLNTIKGYQYDNINEHAVYTSVKAIFDSFKDIPATVALQVAVDNSITFKTLTYNNGKFYDGSNEYIFSNEAAAPTGITQYFIKITAEYTSHAYIFDVNKSCINENTPYKYISTICLLIKDLVEKQSFVVLDLDVTNGTTLSSKLSVSPFNIDYASITSKTITLMNSKDSNYSVVQSLTNNDFTFGYFKPTSGNFEDYYYNINVVYTANDGYIFTNNNGVSKQLTLLFKVTINIPTVNIDSSITNTNYLIFEGNDSLKSKILGANSDKFTITSFQAIAYVRDNEQNLIDYPMYSFDNPNDYQGTLEYYAIQCKIKNKTYGDYKIVYGDKFTYDETDTIDIPITIVMNKIDVTTLETFWGKISNHELYLIGSSNQTSSNASLFKTFASFGMDGKAKVVCLKQNDVDVDKNAYDSYVLQASTILSKVYFELQALPGYYFEYDCLTSNAKYFEMDSGYCKTYKYGNLVYVRDGDDKTVVQHSTINLDQVFKTEFLNDNTYNGAYILGIAYPGPEVTQGIKRTYDISISGSTIGRPPQYMQTALPPIGENDYSEETLINMYKADNNYWHITINCSLNCNNIECFTLLEDRATYGVIVGRSTYTKNYSFNNN